MATKEEWLALAARCEAADRPDREIDRTLYYECECEPIPATGISVFGMGVVVPGKRYTHMIHGCPTDGTLSPHYTASLDAITALIAEKLPGWRRYVEEIDDARWFGGLKPPHQSGAGYRGDLSAYAATGALALCAAFLRAMAAGND